MRTLFGMARFATMILASTYAPLTLTTIVDTTSPFLISIIAFFLVSEPILLLDILSMVVCFGCVVIICLQSNGSDEESTNPYDKVILGLVFAQVSAICNSFSAVLNRSLKETSPHVLVLFSACFFSLVIISIILIEAAITQNGFRIFTYTSRQYSIALSSAA